MKKAILLLLTSFVVLSCSSSDDDTTSPINGHENKLKSIEYISYTTDEHGNHTSYKTKMDFSYGSNGYANKVKVYDEYDNSVRYEYYDYNGNEVEQWRYSGTSNENITSNYFYENGFIYKSINTEDEGPHIKKHKYNNSGDLIETEYLKGQNQQFVSVSEFVYDNRGNVKKETIEYPQNTISYTYEYDNKNNPFKNVFPKSYLKIIFKGENNIINDNGDIIEYEYNSKGYPVKESQDYGDYTQTTLYEYY